MKFRVIQILSHSPGLKQIELIDETQFSATKEDREKFTSSMVLPEAEVNFKERDIIEITIEPAD
jgi:hypothetical protein